jgi:hypothetical protein
MVNKARIALMQDTEPLTTKRKKEDTQVDVPLQRKESKYRRTTAPQIGIARVVVHKLAPKVISRVKSTSNTHTTKYARLPKVDKKKKVGMYMEPDEVDYETDLQIQLTNLNTVSAIWADWDDDIIHQGKQSHENTPAIQEEEWNFLRTLAPWIKVDQDEYGRLVFRSGDYGVLFTKEEVNKFINMVAQNKTMEEIAGLLEFEALYNSSTEEFGKTEGEGLCAILALVGTIKPQLNSYSEIRTRRGRNDIADIIEKDMIPSTKTYTLPEGTHIDQGAQERMEYKDHTIEYLEQTVILLRETMDTEVERERWMYASSSATVIQASPYEAAFWQGIGVDRWISLYLWSRSAEKDPRQTVKAIQNVLRPCTRHIVSLNSHCFNIGDIRPDACVNLINEIVLAIEKLKQKDEADSKTQSLEPQLPVHRVKRRVKSGTYSNLITHNNIIGMSALPDKTNKRSRHTNIRRIQGKAEDASAENTKR